MTKHLGPALIALSVAGSLALLRAQGVPGGIASADHATPVTVTVNRAVKHQTILGWGGTLSFSRNLNYMDQRVVDQLIDDLVDNLGLTFLRVQDGVLDEPFNDNADPSVIDWTRFHDGAAIDRDVERGLRRFITQVRARGGQPAIMLVKSWRGPIPSWMTNAEIAEHLFANAQYYKQRHNIDITFISVSNDADSALLPPSRYPAIASAFDSKARAAGLSTRLTFDEGRNAEATWNAVSALRNNTDFWSRVGLLSWHGPGSTDTYRTQLRDFAVTRGIPTAMSGFSGATIADLFTDLTQANVSYWARNWIVESGLAAADNQNTYFATGFDGVSFRHNQAYHRFRTVMAYVPPGAVRVDAVSSDPALRVAVFEKNNIAYVVGLNSSPNPMRVTVAGLSSFTRTTNFDIFSGPERLTVSFAPGAFRPPTLPGDFEIPGGEVGASLQAPPDSAGPIPSSWMATPASITPSTTTRLTARASSTRGFEGGFIIEQTSYDWKFVTGPAVPVFEEQAHLAGAATVRLTTPGLYEFQVLMAQSSSAWPPSGPISSRTLHVRVFAGNEAPVITEGYRYYRDEWLIAPQSSQTYGADFISAGDIDGDPVTTSFSVISQPSGANAAFNGTTVTGMTRTGDYVFRFTASDATHTVTRDFTRRVVAEEEAPGPAAARRRPESTPPTGFAEPRRTGAAPSGSSAGSAAATTSPAVVTRTRHNQNPDGYLDLIRDLLGALESDRTAGPRWRRLDLLDVDDDGQIDVIRVELIDGRVWTIAYPLSS